MPTTSAIADSTVRSGNGYAPIREYAAIGDGRTAALVCSDGSIDWLCWPDFDSSSVFARILDAKTGGCFELRPEEPFEAERRYQDGSNVLETTFRTASGTVRVTDALTMADRSWLSPLRELVRKVDGLAGRVSMRWRVEPRLDYALREPHFERRAGRLVVTGGRDALALAAWGAGNPTVDDRSAGATFAVEQGESALLELSWATQEPLVLAGRTDTLDRLARTERFWPEWTSKRDYEGRWREQVLRSALALKLLVFSPSGAVVAAPTASLPEWPGGERNWDYRFAWIRDAAFMLIALLRVGCPAEAHAFFWWLSHATSLSVPELHVLYRLDGGSAVSERELRHFEGYERSTPVRVGNAAAGQLQLDVYGPMLECVWLYACETDGIEAESGRRIARIADWVAANWRRPDHGIWEVRDTPRQFVQSKAMCWVALDRASRLADRGLVPDRRTRWEPEAAAIRRFVDEHGWDERRRSYLRAPDLDEVDAGLLTLALLEYEEPSSPRIVGTVEAVRRELAVGPFVHRYRGPDGVEGQEGHFLACSFWLAGALAKIGRVNEAIELMDELVALANDVGLYAEEVDDQGRFLGNFPQALVHLALVNAAVVISEKADER